MIKGKLIVFEGIYGAGRLVVALVDQVRAGLAAEGIEVYELDSPDSGRAQLMGATSLDGTWRYGSFDADFFHELAARARVSAVAREQLAVGKTVLCKSYTLSSVVYAELKGHDWFREDLNVLEARARGMAGAHPLAADLTIFVDLSPEAAARELGERMTGFVTVDDLERQRALYLAELARLPAGRVKTLRAAETADAIFPEAMAAVRGLRPT
jgi:thymidylate kinase